MELGERLYYLLVGWRDLCQRLRGVDRERGKDRYRNKLLIRQVDEAKEVVE